MTTLNAAPTTASAAPTGSAGAAAVPARAAQAVPLPLPATPSQGDAPRLPELRLLGSGARAADGTPAIVSRPSSIAIALDKFAQQSGPDASVETAAGVISVHTVFQLDAKTRELSVAIVGDDGQLIRLIPPESVARMIAAMATYRGR